MRTHTMTLVAATAALLFSAAGYAADVPATAASGAGHRGPSPQAIAACAGKAEGAAVTWVGRSGAQRTGTCKMIDGQLVARLNRMRIPSTPASGTMK
jgi:hypothetical protein